MKKHITKAALVLLLALMTTAPAWAQNNVSYRVYNASTNQFEDGIATNPTPVTAETTAMSDGWYMVNSNVTVSSRIDVTGTVNLILCDGMTLTATQGLHVPTGVTLNIYGQSGGTGGLTATQGGSDQAGIGGNSGEVSGTITIHGGNVTSTGGWSGAGIGGGHDRPSGSITIYGGTVNAHGGDRAAGIGGGTGDYSGGSVTIMGGTVTAWANTYSEYDNSQAIGIGQSNNPSTCTLLLGDVKVYNSSSATTPVALTYRESTCHSKYVRLTTCDHHYVNNECTYCGAEQNFIPIPYLVYDTESEDFVQHTANVATYVKATTTTMGVDGSETYYAVKNDVTVSNRLEVLGTVHLILCDGKTLTATDGITVHEGNTLNIHGQEGGTGAIVATSSGGNYAAIGTLANYYTLGTINFHGGTITATGGAWSAAIGGGVCCGGGAINIYGGHISATATNPSQGEQQAFGHGSSGSDVSLSIVDGLRVYADNSSTPVAYNSRINALQQKTAVVEPCTQHNLSGNTCTYCGIHGIILNTEFDNRAAIAEAAGAGTTFHRVQIDGLTLYRDGTWNTICLPFNLATLSGTPLEGATLKTLATSNYTTQNDGTLTLTFTDATSIEAGKPYIVKWNSGSTIENPVFTKVTLSDATANVETTYATLNGSYMPFANSPLVDAHNTNRRAMHAALSITNPSQTGYTFGGWYTDAALQNAVTTIPFDDDGTVTLYAKWTPGEQPTGIPYLKYNTGTGEFETLYATSYTVVESSTTTLNNNTLYVLSGNVTVSSRIEVSGTAHLILLDGATLTASAGIHVGSGKTLNIYAQSDGTGSLIANASTARQAGIGGNQKESNGTITIHGGVITASCSGGSGAAIGSGGNTEYKEFSNSGRVNIHGGTITATGGGFGAGIGGGMYGKSGTINITGGTITATGGANSAGIGGGHDASANTITITGGTIYATGNNGQAIGKGSGSSTTEGTLTLGDMKVYASANNNTPVNASNRVSTCRSSYAKLLPCTEHNWTNGTCKYCGISSRHVTYDSNNATSGTVPTDATDYGPNQVVTVRGNTGNLKRTGYTFARWNTQADGSGTSYSEGATFIIMENTTLYADWSSILELAGNADNSGAISAAAADGKQHRVVLDGYTLYRDGTWNTLVLPFNLASLTGTPLEGFRVKALTSTALNDGTLTMNFSDDLTSIEAGKPYIVKWDDADLVIRSAADWNTFAQNIANGTETYEGKVVKLAADISVSTMTGGVSFRGTFDGCGHTLNVSLSSSEDFVSPFSHVAGATIKNLIVTGTVNGAIHCSGLVGGMTGNPNLIENCDVRVAITCSSSHCGGFIGHADGSTNTIRNCRFSGSINGGSSAVGIFQGWSGSSNSLINCLAAGTYTNCGDLRLAYGDNCTITETYKTQNIGSQGTYTDATGELLRFFLGSGWEIRNDQVVPKMENSIANIVNPTFENVLISDATANVETANADFIGSYAPITGDGLLLDSHNPDGDAMHAALKAKREGYTFEGWYSDAALTTPVTTIPFAANGTVSLYIKVSTPVEYTITYNLNGGTNHADNPATYNIESATITLQAPDKTGYNFGGWFDNEDCTGNAVTSIATGSHGDMTLYAKWLPEELALANNSNNSSAISTAVASGMYYDVTLADRTIYRDGDWNTLCLPFDVDDITGTQLEGATVKTLESTTFNDGTLTMSFSDNLTSIEAGKPYIVKWNADLVIRSADDWNTFASNVTNGTESYQGKVVKLANDISVTTMVGTSSGMFKGTFDGCGHTLTVNLTNVGTYGAPFQYIDGATIRNLHTAGTISGTDILEGGIAGRTYGTTRIENCRSSVSLTTTKGNNGAMGGIVGVAESESLSVTNCLFDGSLLGSSNTNCAGIVNWRRNSASINISNSLFAPSEVTVSTTGAYTITRPVSVTNCYYKQSLGTVQGTDASAMSNETLVSNLGDGWEIRNNQVVPKMINSVDNIVNPVFSNVLISDATANVSTNYADFIGSYAPITTGLLDSHNPNGDAMHAAISINEPAHEGYTFSWYTDAVLTTPVTTIPFSANGTVTLYAKNSINRKITGHNGNDDDGWVFIASPVSGSITPTAVGNLQSDNYDLYRFNQAAAKEWQNWKFGDGTNAAPGFSLENGRGYLYATEETRTLVFTGLFNTDETMTVTLDYTEDQRLAGWNLVGNPFPVAATITNAQGNPQPFYVINGRNVVSNQGSSVIEPCTGVMVQASGANETVTFTRVSAQSQAPQPNGLQITLTQPTANTRGASNTQVDNAIVSFNEGESLEKFVFNADLAKLYIPQGREDYSIAFSEKRGVMPLNFEPTKDGKYTISVNPEGVEMNYLHLIDNITGADVDLLQTSSYTFEGHVSDYASRFKLVFSAMKDIEEMDDEEDFAFIHDGEIIIEADGIAQIIDVMGRIIIDRRDAARHVSTNGMTPGVYVLRLINGENVKTQKIVVK